LPLQCCELASRTRNLYRRWKLKKGKKKARTEKQTRQTS